MMTENQDFLLESVFAEARQDLDGEVFSARVMSRTRKLLYQVAAGAVAMAAVILAGVWLLFGLPLLEFAVLISQVLTMTMIDLGEGWLALVFMPVNNIASLIVIIAKTIHLVWKRAINSSFAS